MALEQIGVLGCGLMGAGIAQVAVQSGYRTLIFDTAASSISNTVQQIQAALARDVKRQLKTQAEMNAILERLQAVDSLESMAACGLIIESIPEVMSDKRTLFAELDRLCPPETMLASDTSALSISGIAMATRRSDRIAGLHFHQPVSRMRLVEVIPSIFSSQETIDSCVKFVKSLGKTAILAKDTPGFIVNRLLMPYVLDGIRLLEQGLADRDAIDTAMQLGCNHPMGPLQLADYIGLDTIYHTAVALFDGLKEERFKPPVLLEYMVHSGFYGVKSGCGFYNYSKPQGSGDLQIKESLEISTLFR